MHEAQIFMTVVVFAKTDSEENIEKRDKIHDTRRDITMLKSTASEETTKEIKSKAKRIRTDCTMDICMYLAIAKGDPNP